MKNRLFVLLVGIGLITGLFGFSTSVSPTEHNYNPVYTDCETYALIPATATCLVVGNLDELNTSHMYHGETINATVIQNTGSITITVENLAMTQGYGVSIDGTNISNFQLNGSDVVFSRTLENGTHTIAGTYKNLSDVSRHFTFQFVVTSADHYFQNQNSNQNSYANIFPCTSGTSEYGAIRPALFVEGFSAPGIIDGGASYTNSIISNWKNQLTGSKIYRLELTNPTQDVRDNAMIVLGALRFIHNVQPTNQLLEGTSVYGYSMGGILARYALAFAEHWNIKHYCTQYISIDAPHRGAALNNNFQDMLCNLNDWMNSNATYISLGGQDPNQLDPYIDGLMNDAALQLIRNNKFAVNGGVGSYVEGSTTFLELFAEINEEERGIMGIDNVLINSNPIEPVDPLELVKPGFPYKQNNIKSFAYANGSLQPSGNHTNSVVADYNIHIHVEGDLIPGLMTSSDNGTAYAEPYDCQPGSVLDDIGSQSMCHQHQAGWWGHFDFDLNQFYAPVLVPTRSSLYLKANSVTGGSPILPLNIYNFGSLSPYEALLTDHTYFDKLFYAPAAPNQITETVEPDWGQISHPNEFDKWNWRHGELGRTNYDYDNWVANNVTTAGNWLNQPENRAICTIKGHVNRSDFTPIRGTMYIDGLANREFEIETDGSYQIPYLYTKDAQIRLEFNKSGCFPSYRNISLLYNQAMMQDYTVTIVNMYASNFNNILVSKTGNGSFTAVSDAVSYLNGIMSAGLYNGQPIKIRVMQETYPGGINLSELSSFSIPSFTIEGVGSVSITSGGITIEGGYMGDSTIPTFTVKNLKFDHVGQGIKYVDGISTLYDNHARMNLNVQECTFSGCGGDGTDTRVVGGVHFEGAGTIQGCLFEDNIMTTTYPFGNAQLQFNQAGALKVLNNTNQPVTVTENIFRNNSGNVSGGVILTGTGDISFYDNDFDNNLGGSETVNIPGGVAHDLSVYDAYSVGITNNRFKIRDVINRDENNHYAPSVSLYSNFTSQTDYPEFDIKPIEFSNNTLVNSRESGNQTRAITIKDTWDEIEVNQAINITNNVFSYPNRIGRIETLSDTPPHINNNIFHNVTAYGFQPSLLTNGGNMVADPCLDVNYVPVWNTTVMSPCIDAGIGEYELDGTPPDIGANKAIDHAYWTYNFRKSTEEINPNLPQPKDTWQWVSYPVINLTQGKTVAETFFSELLGKHEEIINDEPIWYPNVMQEVLWFAGNVPNGISWINGEWSSNIYSHNVTSAQGYKVKLLPGDPALLVPPPVTLHHSGLRTPSTTYFTITGSVDPVNHPYENWIGYFNKDSSTPANVFASIWNDIILVEGKSWSLHRNSAGVMEGTSGVINDGDMVVIITHNTHQFRWVNTIPVPPWKKPIAQAFEYNEKADYTPVYIDLSSVNTTDLKEIGLFLDDECIGAVVVEDSLEMICAYLEEDESLDVGEVELEFVYESKSAPLCMQSMKVKNADLIKANPCNLTDYPVYHVKVKSPEENDLIPPPLALENNYPNPFNPETTIRYSIDEPGMVALEIYNLKGQLVRILSNGYSVQGGYSVIWNGSDSNGNACSSGVYFYRLRTKNKTLVQKMLMLK